jgi:hypothetical protein
MSSADPDSPDSLLQRYRRASGDEPVAPTPAVREAILAESRRIAAQNQAEALPFDRRPAANEPRWKLAALGTCAAALLAVLLIAPRYPQRSAPGAPTSANVAAPAAQAAPKSAAEDATVAQPSPAVSAYTQSRAISPFKPSQGAPAADATSAQSTATSRRLAAQNYAPPAQELKTQNLAAAAPAADARARTTALLSAVASADRQQILSALDQGAAVDQADDSGRTPLMLAVQAGETQIVQLLLQRGADPTVADRSGLTPLQRARLAHRTDIVKLLEAAGTR